MEIVAKCNGINFSLTWEGGTGCFEGVDSFKYLERFLYWLGKDW